VTTSNWLALVGLASLLTAEARAAAYYLPADGADVIGADERTKATYRDTLPEIARRYDIGYEEIVRANPGVDVWLPGEGTDILLPGRRILPPGPREGIVINLPERRLYYFPRPKEGRRPRVITYPVSIGRTDRSSPLGQTEIVAKVQHPTWYPTESVREEHAANGDLLPTVVPPGPGNPLGDFEMRLAVGHGTFLIHSTNNPLGVGTSTTHGCFSLYPEDMATLFPLVAPGTKVWLIDVPVKITHVRGDLLLEAHQPVESEGDSAERNLEVLSQALEQALGGDTGASRWDSTRDALLSATGMPTLIAPEAVQ
jgi:L,D-transpeptidase ErfK/SrfK